MTTYTASEPDVATPAGRAADLLQLLLVDLTELATQAKQLHWNVVGPGFRDLHVHLDEIVDDARGFADVVAERMRAVDATPDARTATVLAATTLAPVPAGRVPVRAVVPHVVGALRFAVATARRIHDDVDRADPSTADLLHGVIVRLEQQAWMLGASSD